MPLHLLRPRIEEDDPAPHRFAQGVGAIFLIASSLVLFLTKATAVGWTLDLIVLVLAGINLTVGFCAGCFVYCHLGRIGLLPRVRYQGAFHLRGGGGRCLGAVLEVSDLFSRFCALLSSFVLA